MKKILKKITVGLLTIVLLLSSCIIASAAEITDENIMPYYTNCNKCSLSFTVSDPGEAHVGITYNAKSDVFSKAQITVKIQKKFLGFFWRTVDIGIENNEWTDSSTSVNGYFYNCFEVGGTGTYKAIFTVKIIGVDGSVDLIEEEIESKYS